MVAHTYNPTTLRAEKRKIVLNLSLVGIHTETMPQKKKKGGDGGTGEMTG